MFPWGTLHVHAALLAARLQMRLHPCRCACTQTHRRTDSGGQWRGGWSVRTTYPPHESEAVCVWSSGADRDPIAMSALCSCSQLSSPGRLRPHSQRPHTCRQMSAWAFDVSCSIGSQPASSQPPACCHRARCLRRVPQGNIARARARSLAFSFLPGCWERAKERRDGRRHGRIGERRVRARAYCLVLQWLQRDALAGTAGERGGAAGVSLLADRPGNGTWKRDTLTVHSGEAYHATSLRWSSSCSSPDSSAPGTGPRACTSQKNGPHGTSIQRGCTHS